MGEARAYAALAERLQRRRAVAGTGWRGGGRLLANLARGDYGRQRRSGLGALALAQDLVAAVSAQR